MRFSWWHLIFAWCSFALNPLSFFHHGLESFRLAQVVCTRCACLQKIVHPTNCSPPCVKNAVCVVGGQCLCEPPYTGLGTKGCDIPDLCDDNTNGGCSNHAICRQDQLQVTCTCKPPYVGTLGFFARDFWRKVWALWAGDDLLFLDYLALELARETLNLVM